MRTMAKININKTELIWPGKYNEDGTLKEVPRVSLPFQVIERVNENRAKDKEKRGGVQQSFFDVYEGKEGDTFEEGWRNKLIWGDNLLVMGSLLEKFTGKIDLIYIDPPFATGADFSFMTEIGEKELEIEKEQSAIKEKAYRDTWGSGTASYLEMIAARLRLLRELLHSSGSLLLHCDFWFSHVLGTVCDEVFGLGDRGASADQPGFRNEIVWLYGLGGSSPKCYPKKHDTLLWYSKSAQW